MKKIDKLVLKSFLGPFFLTFAVVEFILLSQTLIKYFEDLVGKDLGFYLYLKLIGLFCINIVPVALPLGILLSSIMTYGNLGEHKELTALKSAGISLLRLLRPVFVLVIFLSIGLFYFTEKAVTWANLEVYSLLYDVRKMKPTLDFKEKIFYNGIPGYSIKINEKLSDGKTLKKIMIYDHTKRQGNTDVILADSGIMYMIQNNTYLVMELFNGRRYSEFIENNQNDEKSVNQFLRTNFKQTKLIFSMESFAKSETKKELFESHKIMMERVELKKTSDSLSEKKMLMVEDVPIRSAEFYTYFTAKDTLYSLDSIVKLDSMINIVNSEKRTLSSVREALRVTRNVQNFITSTTFRFTHVDRETKAYYIEYIKRFSQPFSCLILFLIGAPLGAIIKKGGLGIPVLISIIFFIVLYVFSEIGWKWARDGVVEVLFGVWFANLLLVPFGFYFLYQAKNDSNILELDHWKNLILSKIKKIIRL